MSQQEEAEKNKELAKRIEALKRVAPKQITIYGLHDPVSQRLRYIGQTKSKLEDRLRGHMRDKGRNARTRWLRGLKEQGREPIIRTVEVVKQRSGDCPTLIWARANQRECHWIRSMRRKGNDLLNSRKASPYGPSGNAPLVKKLRAGYGGYGRRRRRIVKRVRSKNV